jgi:phosphopantothenoylcysteine decarboxylase/phosphopantothenate--cysteine ligase
MHVVVGVTGGIAAYKASNIIRLLTEAGHSVKVIPTQNALRFIGATTLEALSHNSVDPDLYTDVESVKHVELGQQADLVIVAPATAAFLARYANGMADDLLLNTLLVTRAPVLVAPAMHTEMWLHASTRQNVETLRARGVTVLEPASGRLTGSDTGVGRLPEPEDIVNSALSLGSNQDLAGINVLVTAGGTREPIDPVRFIGNRSSGKQGFAIARAASERGANVTLVSANSAEAANVANHIQVSTSAEMYDAVVAQMPNKAIVIMCAAVADYRVAEVSDSKLKKSDLGTNHVLQLVQNPDILQEISANRGETTKVIVGFAAETATDAPALEKLAHSKLEAKGCDVIVANNVSAGSVFDSEDNEVLIVTESGRTVGVAGSKSAVANQLLDVVLDMLR